MAITNAQRDFSGRVHRALEKEFGKETVAKHWYGDARKVFIDCADARVSATETAKRMAAKIRELQKDD